MGNPQQYGLHSLMPKGTSTAANDGVSDSLISKQGSLFWEKDRNGYIKNTVETRLGISNDVGFKKTTTKFSLLTFK